ncbi:MAG: ImmA/IrrE family metallo-endopeptidase [Clostridia bacterium]|nr:ImmA/IrrE family metallo-endopeptidase [Clostridia bacterium]MBQ8836460.1 ImmA/IrrE family metallo-endopeptidase [Clostridia bacterium]
MVKSEIIEKAKEFCEEHNINSYPVKIVDLCSKYGISVFEEYLPDDVSGIIAVRDEIFDDFNTNRLIVVNLSDSARRRRFTIAHELAHYMLHRNGSQIYAHRDAGQNGGIENEANVFASNILMPEHLVRSALSHLEDESWGFIPSSVKAEYIADEFAVSVSAAQVRLEQLGIS